MKTCKDCEHRELCRYRDEVEKFADAIGRIHIPKVNSGPLRVDINCPSHKASEPTVRIR